MVPFGIQEQGKFDRQGRAILTNPVQRGLLHLTDPPRIVVLDEVGNGLSGNGKWGL